MEDYGGASYERRDLLVVADIGAVKLDPRANLLNVAFVSRQQVIEDDDPAGAFGKQFAYNGGADKARASGDNVVAHD